MKHRLYIIILIAVMAVSATAQTIGEAFYIYRNDGQFNAFFRDEVQSIEYSHYDLDSVYYDENVTQLVYTTDSLYRIPLAAIDSVGFVQPETVYKEDAKHLAGELFDYLIKADSLLLTFDPSLPSTLLPIVGDKLVATELTDKLPLGFTGTVRLVEATSEGYLVTCDSLALEDAVEQFYGVAELVTYRDGGLSRRYLPHRAVVDEQTNPVYVNLPRIHLPLDLTGVIEPRKVYDIEGSARADITIDPVLTGRVTYVVDDRLGFSHYNIHAVLDAETETNVEIAGGVSKSDFLKLLVDKDVPMPWGYPLYIAFGPQFELSGEVALGTTVYANFRHTSDITFYPLATAIAPGLSRLFNTERHTTEMTHFDIDWAYIAARAEAKLYVKGRLGLPFGKHEVGWVGAEFEIGAKCDAELNIDFEALGNAEKGTGLYETLKDSKIEVMPYWGAVAKVGAADDRFEFKFLGRDDYSFWGQKWEWYILPQFSDTKATPKSGSSIEASADITDDCIIPYTVGFSLFDENNNRIGEPMWNDQKFWTRNSFELPYTATFSDVATDKKYKVYPTLRLFGFPVLASPSADVDMTFPVELSNFKVTSSQHQENGFSHNGQLYDYCFNVSVTATLDAEAEGIAEWGYAYLDPNGNEALIPLSQFGRSYTDTRYAYYRNGTPPFTCTLYGYIKYVGSNEVVRGEPHDYSLEYNNRIQIETDYANPFSDYAQLKGHIDNNTDVFFDRCGFLYNTTGDPKVGNATMQTCDINSDGTFEATISNLDEKKVYYYIAFVVVDGNIYYGQTKTLFTIDIECFTLRDFSCSAWAQDCYAMASHLGYDKNFLRQMDETWRWADSLGLAICDCASHNGLLAYEAYLKYLPIEQQIYNWVELFYPGIAADPEDEYNQCVHSKSDD